MPALPLALAPNSDAITAMYIVAFSLFIYGLMQGTHPTTAKRGNLIAAGGMAIAVVATLLRNDVGNWGLIVAGLAVGTAVGVPAARHRWWRCSTASAAAPRR
jgi:NAD(P) transhydrogenase subunit beta